MPCETHVLGTLKIPMTGRLHFAREGLIDSIVCYPSVLWTQQDGARVRQVHVILHHRPFSQSWKWDLCSRCMQVLIFLRNL